MPWVLQHGRLGVGKATRMWRGRPTNMSKETGRSGRPAVQCWPVRFEYRSSNYHKTWLKWTRKTTSQTAFLPHVCVLLQPPSAWAGDRRRSGLWAKDCVGLGARVWVGQGGQDGDGWVRNPGSGQRCLGSDLCFATHCRGRPWSPVLRLYVQGLQRDQYSWPRGRRSNLTNWFMTWRKEWACSVRLALSSAHTSQPAKGIFRPKLPLHLATNLKPGPPCGFFMFWLLYFSFKWFQNWAEKKGVLLQAPLNS